MTISHTKLILAHLENEGPITPLEALQEYGCFRLGARIWDLRQAGHRIVRDWVTIRDGEKRFARYRLEAR
jgi:hypothetical protein